MNINTVLNRLRLTVVAIKKHFSYRLAYNKMLKRETLQERFSDIYEKNLWSSDESGSSEGSEIEYTKPLRNWLVKAIPKYQIIKFVDALAETLIRCVLFFQK